MLCPEGGLQEVVDFKVGGVCEVWVVFIKGGGIEVPDRGLVHDVEAVGCEEGVVERSVGLFHEAGDFTFFAEAAVDCEWSEELLHDKLPGEGEKGRVEEYKVEVFAPFAVVLPDIAIC